MHVMFENSCHNTAVTVWISFSDDADIIWLLDGWDMLSWLGQFLYKSCILASIWGVFIILWNSFFFIPMLKLFGSWMDKIYSLGWDNSNIIPVFLQPGYLLFCETVSHMYMLQ